ncbi:MAG TPA: OsmC family peroxiredoxin, partial [Firmicutes bacterium]|nr:OsmC family peroxiredoxin [Bacillota bacterium]
DLPHGKGTLLLGSGAFEGNYSFSSRFEEGVGTNPEELIGAANAGCFSMALAHELAQAGHTPESVETTANVHLDKTDAGFSITKVHLECVANVPGISEDLFLEKANGAKAGCPVSRALGAIEITLDAKLQQGAAS